MIEETRKLIYGKDPVVVKNPHPKKILGILTDLEREGFTVIEELSDPYLDGREERRQEESKRFAQMLKEIRVRQLQKKIGGSGAYEISKEEAERHHKQIWGY